MTTECQKGNLQGENHLDCGSVG